VFNLYIFRKLALTNLCSSAELRRVETMIIYDPRNYGDVLFRLHGSVIPSIFSRMMFVAFCSSIVCW
jgi:hypothetical protein